MTGSPPTKSALKDAISYILSDECKWNEGPLKIKTISDDIIQQFETVDYGYSFEYFETKDENRYKACISKFIANQTILGDSIRKFINMIFKYGIEYLSATVKPSREKKIEIIPNLYAKFFLRLYSFSYCKNKDTLKELAEKLVK